jgi:hypothetical protein
LAVYGKRKIPGEKTFQIVPKSFQVLEHINDNAYKLNLPGEYNVSATFNVTDLSPFDVGDDLRANPFQEEGNDGDQDTTSKDLVQVPIGPVTRHEQRSSRMYSTDSFKSYGLKQIHGGPLSMIHMGNKESSP